MPKSKPKARAKGPTQKTRRPAVRSKPALVATGQPAIVASAAAALSAAGLWPSSEQPGKTSPAGLFFDHPDLSGLWERPARWTPCPCPPSHPRLFFPRLWLSANR